jgi:glycosyltransferase involved in cell wall biosynthesis
VNIGWIGDMAETGFGRVSREICTRLIERGHDLRIIGINYRGPKAEAAKAIDDGKTPDEVADILRRYEDSPLDGVTLPAGIEGDGMGHSLTARFVTGQLTKDWRPDRLVVLADARAMMERLITDRGALAMVPTFNYVPIEGTGLSPYWRRIWQHVKPVALSDFGARELSALLGQDVPVISHGISDAFHRVTPERPSYTSKGTAITSKEEAKAVFGWQDRTVILRTDRHVPRKDYPAFIKAIEPIICADPDVLVVIHCAPIDEGGILPELIAGLPGAYEGPEGWQHSQVLLTRAHDTWTGLTDEELNVLYNSADIYASPTWSEGWGLTLAEAASCGVPVVTTDFAAGPEVVGDGALLVPPDHLQGNPHANLWSVVDVGEFTNALWRLIRDPDLRERLGTAGEAHVARYSWDDATDKWLDILE